MFEKEFKGSLKNKKELKKFIKIANAVDKEDVKSILKPNYYKSKSGQDVLDVIADFDMDFLMGNVFKYIVRAGVKSKDTIEDLNKAKEYIDRKIKLLENKDIKDEKW